MKINKDSFLDKKSLIWQCRRGMLELDILLNTFLDQNYDNWSLEDKKLFFDLLKEPDPEIYSWIMKQKKSPLLFESLIDDIRTIFRV